MDQLNYDKDRFKEPFRTYCLICYESVPVLTLHFCDVCRKHICHTCWVRVDKCPYCRCITYGRIDNCIVDIRNHYFISEKYNAASKFLSGLREEDSLLEDITFRDKMYEIVYVLYSCIDDIGSENIAGNVRQWMFFL